MDESITNRNRTPMIGHEKAPPQKGKVLIEIR